MKVGFATLQLDNTGRMWIFLYERDQEEAEEDSQEMCPSVMIFSHR